jgi:hypothetical protein
MEEDRRVAEVAARTNAAAVGKARLDKNGRRSRLARHLFENALHDAGADAELPAYLENAVTIGSQFEYSRLYRRLNPTPAQLRTVRPSAREPGIDSFSNDPSLELCKHAEHLKHRLARGRRCI